MASNVSLIVHAALLGILQMVPQMNRDCHSCKTDLLFSTPPDFATVRMRRKRIVRQGFIEFSAEVRNDWPLLFRSGPHNSNSVIACLEERHESQKDSLQSQIAHSRVAIFYLDSPRGERRSRG